MFLRNGGIHTHYRKFSQPKRSLLNHSKNGEKQPSFSNMYCPLNQYFRYTDMFKFQLHQNRQEIQQTHWVPLRLHLLKRVRTSGSSHHHVIQRYVYELTQHNVVTECSTRYRNRPVQHPKLPAYCLHQIQLHDQESKTSPLLKCPKAHHRHNESLWSDPIPSHFNVVHIHTSYWSDKG